MQFAEVAVLLRLAGVSLICSFAACSFDAAATGAPAITRDASSAPVLGVPDGGARVSTDAASVNADAQTMEPDAAPTDRADASSAELDAAAPARDADSDADSDRSDASARDATTPPPDASALPDAAFEDVPVTSPAHAGDYPDDPYGELYVPVPGAVGPDGAARGYKLHVPPGYAAGGPAPVLFAFHGEGSTGALFASYGAELLALADDLGLVLVVPNGVAGTAGALRSWNGGACCDAAALASVDDVAFVRAVLRDVRTRVEVDFARTYALGFSGGAFLAHRLGCEMAEVFSAVIAVGGGIGTPELAALSGLGNAAFAKCAPSRPVSVFAAHGTDDSYVPIGVMTRAVGFWSSADGCNAVPTPSSPPLATGASRCVSYTACRERTQITSCSVTSGGHCWFGSASCGTGNAPDAAQHIGRNSDDLATSTAIAAFIAALRPRP